MPDDIPQIESEWKKKYEKLLEDLAQLLPPCVADEVNIKLQIKRLLEVEEKLRVSEKEKQKIIEENEKNIADLRKKAEDLLLKIEKQQNENKVLIQQVKALKSAVKQQQQNNGVMDFITKIFKKGKKK